MAAAGLVLGVALGAGGSAQAQSPASLFADIGSRLFGARPEPIR